jgi:hypothetical protein
MTAGAALRSHRLAPRGILDAQRSGQVEVVHPGARDFTWGASLVDAQAEHERVAAVLRRVGLSGPELVRLRLGERDRLGLLVPDPDALMFFADAASEAH